ncbi:MAG: hypothetical protein KGQ59_10985, partial [Bdellovibrionales bacterium]|nr:hypothetical protein [Bdellovibrionales bacterium]
MIRFGSALLHSWWAVLKALLLASLFLAGTQTFAAPASKASKAGIISKIQVVGLKRIEEPAVLAKIASQPGQLLDPEQVRKD